MSNQYYLSFNHFIVFNSVKSHLRPHGPDSQYVVEAPPPFSGPQGDSNTSVPLSQQRLSGSAPQGGDMCLWGRQKISYNINPEPHNTHTDTHTVHWRSHTLTHNPPCLLRVTSRFMRQSNRSCEFVFVLVALVDEPCLTHFCPWWKQKEPEERPWC